MTGSQESERSNPLAGRVTIHDGPDYQGVRFVFGNRTERPIDVAFSQPIPESAAPGQFRFRPDRHGDSWTLSADELSVAIEVDAQSTVETGYALTDTDVSTVWNAINEGTVTVSDADGEVLGQVGGLEPNVVEVEDSLADSSEETTSTAETEMDGSTTDGASEEPASDDESASESESAGGQAESESGDETGSVADVDATEVAELAAALDSAPAESAGGADGEGMAGSDTSVGTEQSANQQAVGSGGETGEMEQSDSGHGTDGEAEAADLPATRADYILSDVRGEIQSASEFEWRTLGKRSTPRKLVDRVRSWLGL